MIFQKKPECRKFMYGLPRFFPQMVEPEEAQVFLFMSTFNALLTSISYDDQGAYEVGFAAGVDHAAGVADASVGAATGGAAAGGADVGVGAAAGGADVDAGVGATTGGDAAGLSDDDWWSTTDDGAPTKDSDDKWTTDDDWSDVDDEGDFTDDDEAVLMMHVARCQ